MVPTTSDVKDLPSPLILTPTERFAELDLSGETNDPTLTPHDGLNSLPNDALALVIDYLPCSDAMSFTAVSRVFLHQVAPLVEKLMISHTMELRGRLANRFPNVKNVSFWSQGSSVIREPGFICNLVPFLRSFTNLESIVFEDAIKDRVAFVLQLPDETGQYDEESVVSHIESIIFILCDAFRSNDLSNNISVEELFCPRFHRQAEQCYLCRQVVTYFPVRDLLIVDEENRRLCLNFGKGLRHQEAEDWMLYIIAQRPGGKDALRGLLRLPFFNSLYTGQE